MKNANWVSTTLNMLYTTTANVEHKGHVTWELSHLVSASIPPFVQNLIQVNSKEHAQGLVRQNVLFSWHPHVTNCDGVHDGGLPPMIEVCQIHEIILLCFIYITTSNAEYEVDVTRVSGRLISVATRPVFKTCTRLTKLCFVMALTCYPT